MGAPIDPVLLEEPPPQRLRMDAAEECLAYYGYTVVGELLMNEQATIEIKRISATQARRLLKRSKGYVLQVIDGMRFGSTKFMGLTVMWEEI